MEEHRTRFREFEAFDLERAEVGPTFRIKGRVLVDDAQGDNGEPLDAQWVDHVQEFRCLPEAPAGALDFGGFFHYEQFIKNVLPPDEAARFHELVLRKDFIVHSERLKDIATWLLEEYTGRPTNGPDESPSGPEQTGDTSTGDSPSPG